MAAKRAPQKATIGGVIAALRVQAGWSRRRLAAQVDLDPATLFRIEKGQRHTVDVELAHRICEALDLTLNDLAIEVGWMRGRRQPRAHGATQRTRADVESARRKLQRALDDLDRIIAERS